MSTYSNLLQRFIQNWKHESDFVKINGNILWLIGIINTDTKHIRLEISYNRDQHIMKKIISAHVKRGNYIVSEGWTTYDWLDNPSSGYSF